MTEEKKKKYEEVMRQYQDSIQKVFDEDNKKHLKRVRKVQTDEDIVSLTRNHGHSLYGLHNKGDFDILLERGKITSEQHRCFQQDYQTYRIHRFRENLGTQWFFQTAPLLEVEKYVCYDPTRKFPESQDVYEKVDIHKIDFATNKVFLECRDPKKPYAKKPTYYAVKSIDDMFSALEKAIGDDDWADKSYYCQCLIYKRP